jgi:glutathione S-transferase
LAPRDLPLNEKVRWALDYKDVAQGRRAVTPALQEFTARRLGAGRTVPVLETRGRAIGDSTKIIEEIERRWPEPPLHPADPEERSRALDLEDYFDERCGHDLRRVLFSDNLTEPERFLVMLYGADHPPHRAAQDAQSGVLPSREAALPNPAGDRREVAREGARGVRQDRGRRRPDWLPRRPVVHPSRT